MPYELPHPVAQDFILYNIFSGARGIDQWQEDFPAVHEVLGSVPS